MKNKFLSLLFSVIVISAILSVSAFAEIHVDGSSIVGLDPELNYEYAYVTLENYDAPEYTALPFENELSAGLVAVREVGGSAKYYLIDGENLPENISVLEQDGAIGFVNGTSWKAGSWSTTETNTFTMYRYNTEKYSNYPYWISCHSFLNHSNALSYYNNGQIEEILKAFEGISCRYAYDSDEIIPVEDFYTFSFKAGARSGSTKIIPPNNQPLYTKVVLYTINSFGKINSYDYTIPVDWNPGGINSYTVQDIAIKTAFPDAKGYVMGFEIFPFGYIPDHDKCTVEFIGTGNNSFSINYIPSYYTTIRNDNTATSLPFQYNGANAAYIDGKGMGMFLPDDHITIAELSTILAKLLNNGVLPAQYVSSYENIRPLDWYYKAIACMEYLGAYNNVENSPFDPNKVLTRGEVAQMICNIAKISRDDGKKFIDLGEEHKYYDAITTLSAYGVIKGYADGSCCPDAPVSRAEVVTMINRFTNLNSDMAKTDMSSLESFIDIEGHWAENEILIASNDKVKSNSFASAKSSLKDNGTDISFKTDYISVSISKELAKITEFYNKKTDESAFSSTLTPWFSYIALENGLKVYPAKAEIEDGRLAVTYADGIKAYFIIEAYKNYFTIELDSDLPIGVKYISYANFSTNEELTTEEGSYRLSAVPMSTSATSAYFPCDKNKSTSITTYRATEKAFGSKVGIVFSPMENHRNILKEVTSTIDIRVGVKSTKGGAFTYDEGNEDLFGDYVILSDGLTPENAEETRNLAIEYSVDQIDIHQGASRTFVQGGFSFTCAGTAEEKANGTYISAATFKERIADKITSQGGIQLGLHTYSSLVDPLSEQIVTNPTWQKQFEFVDQNFTLSADMTSNATTISTNGDTTLFTGYFQDVNHGVNYYWNKSGYILVDEEIMKVDKAENGVITVQRAKLGTVATEHKAGARINQFMSTYNAFQPIPGSDLFWHIADLTAQAYNEGGFEMIYLDGFESFNSYVSKELHDFYYSEFIRIILEKCKKAPILEASTFPKGMWAARGRGGALDHPNRSYKKFIDAHRNYNATFYNYYYTSTLGWFAYAPDSSQKLKNTLVKTLFRDDVAHLGATAIAYNMSTVVQPFSVSSFKNYNHLADNVKYYSVYTRLRKAGYFSDSVKNTLKDGLKAGTEYKLIKTSENNWAFREMYYTSNVIRSMASSSDTTFVTGSGNNPYSAQSPFIRIEQRYSADLSATTDDITLLDYDNVAITSIEGVEPITQVNLTEKQALKVRVFGNNSSDGILLSLFAETVGTDYARTDFLIPLNFSGWKEIILLDSDNADYDGYTFSDIYPTSQAHSETYRDSLDYSKISNIRIKLSGNCDGVLLDYIKASQPVNATAQSPSVTIGNTTIKFDTELQSGEYIEYYPEDKKAYKNYYEEHYYDTYKKYLGSNLSTSEVDFSITGDGKVPSGAFTFTYSATPASSNIPLRAKVTIGTEGDVISNESTWTAPEVEIPEGWEKVQLH